MRKLIESALNTSTFRQSVITSVSTFATAGLGAVFYLFLARLMPPADYGLFTLAIGTAMLIVNVADIGSGQSIVKFAGLYQKNSVYLPYARMALIIKIYAGVLSLVIFTFFGGFIAHSILRQPAVAPLMPLAGLSAMALLLVSFPADLARGLQKFMLWGGLQAGSNLFRLALLMCLFFISWVSPRSMLIIFLLPPFVTFLISWIWLDKKVLRIPIPTSVRHQFWSFNKWTAAFIILTSIVSRLDTLLSSRFLSLTDLGIYGLATTMATFMPQLSGALGAVTSAKFASFSDPYHANQYLKKALLFTTGASVAVTTLLIPTAILVIRFTGRPEYWASLQPFIILLVALCLFTSLNPLRDCLFYFHTRPHFFFFFTLSQGLILIVSAYLLIPTFGVVGSALSVLISHLVLSLASIWQYHRLTSKSL